jgi:hypothetical protein
MPVLPISAVMDYERANDMRIGETREYVTQRGPDLFRLRISRKRSETRARMRKSAQVLLMVRRASIYFLLPQDPGAEG